MIAQRVSRSVRSRGGLLVAIALTSCSQADESSAPSRSSAPIVSEQAPARSQPVEAAPSREYLVPWGTGPRALGLIPARDQALARGPNAVAVLPSGDPVVLDSLQKRVLRLTADGPVELSGALPDDDEIAVDADGAMALFSPLRSSITLRDGQGRMLGDLPVPRELRDIQAFSFGSSRRIVVRTAFQEAYELGSPNARLPLDGILGTKREGAAFLPDGQGISTLRRKDGTLELVFHAPNPSSGRTGLSRRLVVASTADSGRILGASGSIACIRVERVVSTPELSVARSVFCIDTATERTVFETGLPAPGLYVPRTELAMGGTRPRVALLHPRPDAMAVIVHDVGAESAPGGGR